MYSGGLVVVDPQGKTLGELDAQRQRGQWVERPGCPNFVSLAADAKGDILALRPSLKIDLVQLVPSAHP